MNQLGRIRTLRILTLGALVILVGRLVWVQAIQAAEYTRRGELMRLDTRQVEPLRGALFDRKGVPLAVTTPSYWVVADTRQMQDEQIKAAAAKLAELLPAQKAADIDQKLRASPGNGWVPLVKNLNLDQMRAVEKARLAGIYTEQHTARSYPQAMAANHVLGYLNSQGVGEYGLEKRYEKELAGTPGEIVAEFTHGKTPIEGTVRSEKPATPGLNLTLTIDIALQQLVEQKLDKVVADNKADRAMVLAMNAQTGEILVMAMRPGAHPGDRNTWGNPQIPADANKIVNWSVMPMSPGSIFKPITVAAALEERAITLKSTFVDPGYIVVGDKRITNWDGYVPPKPTPSTIAELLQNSSNVGMVLIGQQLGKDKFRKYLEAFGFMEKTGIDFSYDDPGFFGDDFSKKRDIDWANMYFGQHLELTPLQMVTAVAAIANGGNLVQPHLVREIKSPDGQVVKSVSPGPRRQVISQATAKEVQQLMVSVVEKGTGQAAKPGGYTVGGKTGTAQKFEKGVLKQYGIADFVGFAPASNPQVVMLVVVDEPKGNWVYGGQIAAPVFAELVPHVMRSLNIAPDTPAALGTEKAPPKATAGVVPDVRHLPLDWARQRLVDAGLKPTYTGKGERVASQSLQPGSPARAGSEIELAVVPAASPSGTVSAPDFTGYSLAEALQLAEELGVTLKAGGTGFVAAQEPKAGAQVPLGSLISVRLAPPR